MAKRFKAILLGDYSPFRPDIFIAKYMDIAFGWRNTHCNEKTFLDPNNPFGRAGRGEC